MVSWGRGRVRVWRRRSPSWASNSKVGTTGPSTVTSWWELVPDNYTLQLCVNASLLTDLSLSLQWSMQLTRSTTEQQPSPSPRRTGRHENASARRWIWRPTLKRKGKSSGIRLSKWVLRVQGLSSKAVRTFACRLIYCESRWTLPRWQMKWLERWIWNQRRSSWPRVPCGLISLRAPLILPAAKQTSSKHTTTTPSSSANSETRCST